MCDNKNANNHVPTTESTINIPSGGSIEINNNGTIRHDSSNYQRESTKPNQETMSTKPEE